MPPPDSPPLAGTTAYQSPGVTPTPTPDGSVATRLACHGLIDRLPDAALAAALAALTDEYDDYLAHGLTPRPLHDPKAFPVKFRYGGVVVSTYPATLELD